MQINAGLDTGDMLLEWSTDIGPEETAVELGPRLAEAGADLLIETLQRIEEITPRKQDDAQASYAPILKKEDGRADFASQGAAQILQRVKGFQPWPGVYTVLRGTKLNIWKAALAAISLPPGQLHQHHKRLYVGCAGDTAIELLEIQLEGRKRMAVPVFLNGFSVPSSTTSEDRIILGS
jgi:methionyl-tRNA formyltransferase